VTLEKEGKKSAAQSGGDGGAAFLEEEDEARHELFGTPALRQV